VDTRGDIWVIDYERTGYGPIVLDWTELEVDILTQSPELDLTEPASLHLLQVLLASPTVSIPEATPVEDATLGKLWAVLYWLRRQADSTLPTSDARPYLWGVLFNALFRLTLLFADLDGWERGSERQVLLRIALLAGLLCHRLDHVNGGWSLVGRQGPTKPKNAIG
jgi:membrane-associated phospholipid phosphatase